MQERFDFIEAQKPLAAKEEVRRIRQLTSRMSARLSYVLKLALTDTQLQITRGTFISCHHAPLILTADTARTSMVQVSRTLHQALERRQDLHARASIRSPHHLGFCRPRAGARC